MRREQLEQNNAQVRVERWGILLALIAKDKEDTLMGHKTRRGGHLKDAKVDAGSGGMQGVCCA